MYRFLRTAPRWQAWLLAALLLPLAHAAAQPYRFAGVARVVAIGDVHGSYPEFVGVLQGTGLVDAQSRWSGGKTHLVSTGDLLSRGDQARQVVELLMRLQREAAAAGGAVHVLLGNHEVMSLTGDLRYVSPGEFASFADGATATPPLPRGFQQRMRAFAPDGPIGGWLLQRPVMIVINGDLFVHGGLSAKLAGRTLEDINREAIRDVRAFAESWQALVAAGALQPGDDFDRILAVSKSLATQAADVPPSPLQAPAAALVEAVKGLAFQPDGPLWYRGSSLCHPFIEAPTLESVLAGLNARRLVMGHTPTLSLRIQSRLDAQALRIDTGMNKAAYAGRASALVIEGGRTTAFHVGEGMGMPRVEDPREWTRPDGMSDAQIEAFLAGAPIVAREELSVGVTKPLRLTLEQGGRRIRAVFKSLDTDPGIERKRWERRFDPADRYVYDVAAYKLDRILGLQMVPVAVLRSIDGTEGVLQYWVEDTISETERIQQRREYAGECRYADQHALMNAFDVLIHNVDRNTGNILYDRDWQLWMIDHSRAFGTELELPPELRKQQIVVGPPLAKALEAVTVDNLTSLAPYLNPRQLQALARRAQRLRSGP